MSDSVSHKRKGGSGGGGGERGGKRRQGGTGGKWQTPHQKTKDASYRGSGKIEAGDVGIWATCVKNKEGKATEELKALFEQYAEKIHGIVPHGSGNPDEDDEDEELDIEASIRAEVAAMSNAPNKDGTRKAPKLFQPIFLDVQCVLFFRTQAPIEPLEFVERICNDALLEMADEGVEKKQRRCRFVNRLTPMQAIGRATEKGVEEVGRKVLGEVFELVEKTSDEEEKEKGTTEVGAKGNVVGSEGKAFSYSIRPTIRNHSSLKRGVVIKLIADLVGPKHKVNLTKPEKVIIVEIYQTICGITVVDGPQWEGPLKRFNLFEIYQPSAAPAATDCATPGGVVSVASVTTHLPRTGGAESPKPAGLDLEKQQQRP